MKGAKAGNLVLLVALSSLLVPGAVAQDTDTAPIIWLAAAGADPDGVNSLFGHAYLVVKIPDQAGEIAYEYQVHPAETAWSGLPSASIGTAVMDLEGRSAEAVEQKYTDEGREVRRTPLLLTDDEAWRLVKILEDAEVNEGALPYDMIRSNCSTGLRDLLNGAMSGALHGATNSPSGATVRSLAVPFVQHQPLNAQLWLFLYGSSADVEVSHWESMFIPRHFEKVLRLVPMGDDRGPLAEETIITAQATKEPPYVPFTPASLRVIAAIVAANAMAGVMFAMRRWPAVTSPGVGMVMVLAGLVGGLLSLFMLLASGGSMGEHLRHNQNLYVASPLAWFLIPVGIGILLRRSWGWRWFHRLAVGSLLLLVGMAIAWEFPLIVHQRNETYALLALLFWGGFMTVGTFGARISPVAAGLGLRRGKPTRSPQSSDDV